MDAGEGLSFLDGSLYLCGRIGVGLVTDRGSNEYIDEYRMLICGVCVLCLKFACPLLCAFYAS